MRRALDTLYLAALWFSALCLIIIALMVGVQVSGRIADGFLKVIGQAPRGIIILSLDEIGGYLLGAASFLALAGTLKAGAHIRVTMILSMVSEAKRRYLEIFAFAFSACVSAYITWQLASFAWYSFLFDEVSNGVIRVPLCYPQAVMAFGALLLTVSLVDELIIVVTRGRPTFRAAEDAITLGKEG